ncbi:hypothetical protein AAFF_G00214150 [Aldrovandia affinis]|uniref:Uncharacterized protein n=1 Tax=Aldrovandia affinis TaxID=143900 RepID=A0AAD7RGX0_9TELE|nr:hypothetical protein AAFF_G00214150 [Aldrovandia affinis]
MGGLDRWPGKGGQGEHRCSGTASWEMGCTLVLPFYGVRGRPRIVAPTPHILLSHVSFRKSSRVKALLKGPCGRAGRLARGADDRATGVSWRGSARCCLYLPGASRLPASAN